MHQLGFSKGRHGAHSEWQFQGNANKSETTTLEAQTTKDPQRTHSDMRQKLQHSTLHRIQNYSGSTVGTVAPTRAAVPPAVAYACNASLYTTSFPLTKATLSSITVGDSSQAERLLPPVMSTLLRHHDA
jgi:hypothetical protein